MRKVASQTSRVTVTRTSTPGRGVTLEHEGKIYLPERVVKEFGWFFFWATVHMLVFVAAAGYVIARWYT